MGEVHETYGLGLSISEKSLGRRQSNGAPPWQKGEPGKDSS